jgi:hypothetical protein
MGFEKYIAQAHPLRRVGSYSRFIIKKETHERSPWVFLISLTYFKTHGLLLPDGFDIQHMGGGKAVAEGFEILEGPDNFLVAGDFKKLGVLRAGMAVAHDDVAIGQNMKRGDPCELDSSQFGLVNFPNDLTLGVNLEHSVVVTACDQGVSIG